MSTAIEMHQPTVRRSSHLWKPVILAAGFEAEALELLVFWFSDIASHVSEPVLIVAGTDGGLPDTVDQLGLVSQVRSCAKSQFAKWADHADIFTVGSGAFVNDHCPSCPIISVANGSQQAIQGINGFHTRSGEEWRDAVRALLDDPALCLALSGRREIRPPKRI